MILEPVEICPHDGERLADHPQCIRCSMWICPGEQQQLATRQAGLQLICQSCLDERRDEIRFLGAMAEKRYQKAVKRSKRGRPKKAASWAA